MKWWLLLLGFVLLPSCAGTDNLQGIAATAPFDRAVLVSGGAFFASNLGAEGTFLVRDPETAEGAPDPSVEAIPFDRIIDVLRRGRVFQRVEGDPDTARRRRMPFRAMTRRLSPEFLQEARRDGYDLLLVVQELRDGPIESKGTNNRWPVTFATWILLGVGALIPDHTFESRATLKVVVYELQTGYSLGVLEVESGPVDLALTERTDFLGLLSSIIVPPFWVGNDRDALAASVRATTERRLLLSLASKLKSDVFVRSLGGNAAADLSLTRSPEGLRVVVLAKEALSVVRLEGEGVSEQDAERFAAELIRSQVPQENPLDRESKLFRYEAAVPDAATVGLFQVRVGTLGGRVESATFSEESAR